MNIKKLSMDDLNRQDLDSVKKADKSNFAFVVDNVRSGQNIGSIFRTADALGAREIVISGLSPLPPNKEILKTALGATESVKWTYLENSLQVIEYLKKEGYVIVAVEQTSASVRLDQTSFAASENYALILGNEVDGVSEVFVNGADTCVEIPQFGVKHSLNVSVCAGIVAWHILNKCVLI